MKKLNISRVLTFLLVMAVLMGVLPFGITAQAEEVYSFDLAVGGKSVTIYNNRDVLGDGVFSYDYVNNVLNVNGDSTSGAYGIESSISGLTINIVGDSALSGSTSAIRLNADTTIRGIGSLRLSAPGAGIHVSSSVALTIQNAFIDVTGIWGIVGEGEGNALTVINSSVNVQSASEAICGFDGGITLDDFTIQDPEGAVVRDGTVFESNGTTAAKDVTVLLGGALTCDDASEDRYLIDHKTGNVAVSGSMSEAEPAIIAAYNAEGRMISVQYAEIEVEADPVIPEGAAKIKIFWVNKGEMSPLCRNAVVEVKERTQEESTDSNGIKLLVYGSSFTYSTLGLVPEIIQEIAPDQRFVLGICFQSGATVQNHLDNWSAGTKYTVYSEYDSSVGHWTNLRDTVSGKEAMDRHTWDYIVLQQACRHVTAEADYTALKLFADTITQYLQYPVSFLYNLIQALNADAAFPAQYTQATGREKSDAMFLNMAAYAQRALDDKIISDVIPGGTAVQNARTTSLDSLGIGGDLSEDNLGHLQNGIPTLIPAYAAAYKICQIAGIKPKMYGIPLSPTDAWLTAYNLQTRVSHGSCVGVTEANKRIAQKCAMMAIKHPFEISDMSRY